MTPKLPPLDVHAHIDPSIDPRELLALRAVVLAATRSLAEFERTLQRDDPVTVWGLGTHPRVVEAIDSFSRAEFERLVKRTPLVSEVGLDGNSDVPMTNQISVFEEILTILQNEPRIVSIHSAQATSQTIDLLESHPIKGAVLHWWEGTVSETARAVSLGCRFSVNEAAQRRRKVISQIPRNLILTETDHPFTGDGRSIPGNVAVTERLLSDLHSASIADVRKSIWRSLAALCDDTGTTSLLPPLVRRLTRTARSTQALKQSLR